MFEYDPSVTIQVQWEEIQRLTAEVLKLRAMLFAAEKTCTALMERED